MLNTNYFDHNSEEYTQRTKKIGIVNPVSENLYRGQTCDIRRAIKLWNESPSHKANLDKDYKKFVLLGQWNNDYCYLTLELADYGI